MTAWCDAIEAAEKAIFEAMDVTDGLDMPSAQRYLKAALDNLSRNGWDLVEREKVDLIYQMVAKEEE